MIQKFATRQLALVGFTLFSFAFHSSTAFAKITNYRAAPTAEAAYPRGPRAEMTTGSLCQTSTTFRYPEHIRYCERDVESALKNDIIQEYDRDFGYRIRSMPRSQFKIDHYIPLCAGGSNDRDNLWPQHKSVYVITDPLEPLICQKMSAGRLKQADAIAYIREAKNDLSKVKAILREVNSL